MTAYSPAPRILELGGPPPSPFYDAVRAADFPKLVLRYRNQRWAARIGLDGLGAEAWLDHFGRFLPLPDNLREPLALRYHGHQFRTYNPDIGDGRGFLFAQLEDDAGRLLDLGTKGSGKTPYSRFGDGRLTLKGGVREILATEMLEALGVYTSKSFSVIETGEALSRNDEPSPTRSCVLVRLSHSHVRFGTFQRLAFENDAESIERLVAYCAAHLEGGADPDPAAFFSRVVARTARLVADWTAAGFVHGVLNTDNMTVTGESFDYGPWRFAPTADPGFTAAYFDQTGLYAFGRQAEAGAWNLARLGGCLTLLAPVDALNAALASYGDLYREALADGFFRRLGLARTGGDDIRLANAVLGWLDATRAPYERFFFDWFCGRESAARRTASPLARDYESPEFGEAKALLLAATPERPGRLSHPYFAQSEPCTMLIDEVERVWSSIAEADDWSPLAAKIDAIAAMREAYGFSPSAAPTS
ncbi:MAG: YdiU family protein [Parvularculaceae bacterium]|nr:YdiU family protein [Parvularculaceae bacterium]